MEWTPTGEPKLAANERWRLSRSLSDFRVMVKRDGLEAAQLAWSRAYRAYVATHPEYLANAPVTDDEQRIVHMGGTHEGSRCVCAICPPCPCLACRRRRDEVGKKKTKPNARAEARAKGYILNGNGMWMRPVPIVS